MKKYLYLFILTLILPLYTQATVRTVSNGKIKAQYTDLQTAINQSNAGDTIYLHPSPNSYGNVDMNKQLTVIGVGHRRLVEEGATSSHTAYVNRFQFTAAGSGSSVIGVVIGHFINPGYQNVDGISIIRCRILGNGDSYIGHYSTSTGWLIEGCVFEAGLNYSPSGNAVGVQFTNSVFGKNVVFRYAASSDVIFAHCIFLGDYDAPTNVNSSTLEGVVFSENIFIGRTFDANAKNNFFNNNVIYTSGITGVWANNFDVDNTNAFVDPLFVNYPVDATGVWSYDYDLTLQANSPGKGTSADGTSDLGLSPTFNKYGTPFNPQLINFDLLTPYVAQDGEVKFKIKARSQAAGEF